MSSCQKAVQNTDKGLCSKLYCLPTGKRNQFAQIKIELFQSIQSFDEKVPTNAGFQWIWNTNACPGTSSKPPYLPTPGFIQASFFSPRFHCEGCVTLERTLGVREGSSVLWSSWGELLGLLHFL